MKQVIVRIRDCKATRYKTVATAYFYTRAHYRDEILDFAKTLMPHQEIYIKVGNQYSKYISYEEIMEASEIDEQTFDDELYTQLIDNYSLNYEITNYLPRW